MSRLSLLGNSAAALGSNDVGTLFFFFSCCAFFNFNSFLPAFLLCFFAIFHSYCSHLPVFGKTLVHEFHIFYSHTEWNFFLFVLLGLTLFWLSSAIKLNNIIIIIIIIIIDYLLFIFFYQLPFLSANLL